MPATPTLTRLSAANTKVLWTALVAGALILGVMWWVVGDGRWHRLDSFGFDAFGSHHGTLLARWAHPLAVWVPWLSALFGLVITLLLLASRKWAEAATIAAGPLLIAVAVHVVKSAEQRTRPPSPLTPASGFSFPSSASALSITAIAVALAFARHSGPQPARTRGAIAAGVALSLGTGILMVAIRVHYLTDVIGGWGLGIAVFAGWALLVGEVERATSPRWSRREL